jgi:hypothetical protein
MAGALSAKFIAPVSQQKLQSWLPAANGCTADRRDRPVISAS